MCMTMEKELWAYDKDSQKYGVLKLQRGQNNKLGLGKILDEAEAVVEQV